MRVTADSTLIDLTPGSFTAVDLDVINTGPVIDGITARVIGLPERQVSTKPPVLALFPEATGRLTVTLGVPTAFPAGRHPVTVEVHSRQDDVDPEYVDLDLLVPIRPDFALAVRPQVVRAHRNARFVVTVTNNGNARLEIALGASDPEKIITPRVTPPRVLLEAGHSSDVLVEIRGPRMILGAEIDRPVTVTGTATVGGIEASANLVAPPAAGPGLRLANPAGSHAGSEGNSSGPAGSRAGPVAGLAGPRSDFADQVGSLDNPRGEQEQAAPVVLPHVLTITLRQRPWITRGMLTTLILLAIIALWAAVFLFGLRQVFAADPPTKTAPKSFFVASDIVLVGVSDPAAGAAPAGALPKDGLLPAGLGGTIAGTVTAASSGEPVGRIQVDALRPAADGSLLPAGSSATQADGSYQVAGLFPGPYLLKFAAPGFDPIFYPAAPDQGTAAPITVSSAQVNTGVDVVITGQPASITGTVDPGDTLQPVVTTVTARATQGANAGQQVATTTTDGANAYTLPGLPAPAVYELSFTADGYQPNVVQTSVDGAAARIQPTVLLSAGPGQIAGTVTDGTSPIGGVTVATTVDGKPVTTGTPTTGAVGQFVLNSLPTPATYVLTVSAAGFGGNTVVVDLGPGQLRNDLSISLAAGTGQVTGRLVGADGAGIGGAVITVGGMLDPPTSNTVTAGTVGAFSLAGLPAGSSLTLTFDKPGFAQTTVPVQLGANTAPLTVTMADSLGRINGTVTGTDGAPITGATVTATDGKRSWPVTSSSSSPGTAAGGYVIAQLPVGAYTVTAVGPSTEPRTTLVTVTAGGQATADFVLPPDTSGGAPASAGGAATTAGGG